MWSAVDAGFHAVIEALSEEVAQSVEARLEAKIGSVNDKVETVEAQIKSMRAQMDSQGKTLERALGLLEKISQQQGSPG